MSELLKKLAGLSLQRDLTSGSDVVIRGVLASLAAPTYIPFK